MTTINITLPKLHASQKEVRKSDARFKVLACGRRWGKTRLGTALCTAIGLQGGRAWWVAPAYPISSIGWRMMKRFASQIPGASKKEVDKLIQFPGGGELQVKSADNPDSLRGEGLDFVVLDECAFIKEAAWAEALRPALSDRQGGALFISTPKGHNWFWRLWTYQHDDWQAWRFPTSDNPFINPAEIEAARDLLPERIFAQEYLAEFLEDAGIVFRNVMTCATASELEKGSVLRQYVYGIDWGKLNDFTVISVLDPVTQKQVAFDRFNQIDYTVQIARLKAMFERFPPLLAVAERNAMGEPLIDQLQHEGMPVSAFITTNPSKAMAIDALALAFERKDIQILPDPTLINELQAFESERLPGGMLRYSAPDGMHDDCVISLMLAWQGVVGGGVLVEAPSPIEGYRG